MAAFEQVREDEQVTAAARNALLGAAPEREEELAAVWDRIAPRFQLTGDLHNGERLVMEAGLYRYVCFNHRAVRAFWLAAFAAWESYRAVAEASNLEAVDLGRLKELLDAFERTMASEAPELDALPRNVPEPGHFDDDPQLRAPGELATLAVGWALLHEFRHLLHQQDGDGADTCGADSDPSKCRNEEFSCDAYATKFLLEHVDRYAEQVNVDPSLVRRKRQLGIYCALFAMSLIARDRWDASASHPSVQARIDAVRELMAHENDELAEAIASVAFATLRTFMPGAPGVLASSSPHDAV